MSNPWVAIMGGPTAVAFRDLPVGSIFSFPKHPDVTCWATSYRKVSARRFTGLTYDGRGWARFTTGPGTAVVPAGGAS